MPAIIMMITIKPNFEKYTRKDNPVILYIRKIARATVPTPITAFPEALTTNASNSIIKIIQKIFVTTPKTNYNCFSISSYSRYFFIPNIYDGNDARYNFTFLDK